MNLQRLKVFESVSRHLNLTAAAAELHLSQPAVSLQLKLLEREYGLTFFIRKNIGVELTDEGREFLEATRPILARIKNVESRFKERAAPHACDYPELKQDIFTVGSNPILLEKLLSQVLVRFREQWHPDTQLVVEIAGSPTIERLVNEFQLDLALITNPRHLPNCEYEPFRETPDSVAVVVSADSPLRKRSLMSLEELLAQTLIVGAGSVCVEELRQRGYELRSAIHCLSPDAATFAIRRGLGIGLALSSCVQAQIDRQEFVEITVPQLSVLKYRSFIAWNKHRALSTDAQHLIQTLRAMKTESESHSGA